MGEKQGFEENIRRLGTFGETVREELEQGETVFGAVLAAGRMPDGETLGREAERQRRLFAAWASAEAIFVDEVSALGEALGSVRMAIDQRETPSRLDQAFGFLSKSTMRRLQKRRFERRVNPGRLAGLLRRADLLLGIVAGERAFLAGKRKVFEDILTGLSAQRPALVRSLVAEEGGGQTPVSKPVLKIVRPTDPPADRAESGPHVMSRLEAVSVIERLISAGLSLCGFLNSQVTALDTLSHKLQLDAEEILILYRALAEIDGDGGRKLPAGDELAHLSEAVGRYRNNRLVAPDEGRRRKVVDHAFIERFVHPANSGEEQPGEDEPEDDVPQRALLSHWLRSFRPSGGR